MEFGSELSTIYIAKTLKTISGKLYLIEHDKNFSAIKNFDNARENIYLNHNRLIVSEDDNEFFPNFLDYINKGFSKFENNPNIYAICGYHYPVILPRKYK